MPSNEDRSSSRPSLVAGMRRTCDDLPVTESVTVIVVGSMFGPVMATGARDSPLRRQASAAAVAIGPGMPLTMIRREEGSKLLLLLLLLLLLSLDDILGWALLLVVVVVVVVGDGHWRRHRGSAVWNSSANPSIEGSSNA